MSPIALENAELVHNNCHTAASRLRYIRYIIHSQILKTVFPGKERQTGASDTLLLQ